MRPKVVILIFVAGFGLLGIMFVLKGTRSGSTGGQTPGTQINVNSQSAPINDQVVQVNPGVPATRRPARSRPVPPRLKMSWIQSGNSRAKPMVGESEDYSGPH